MLTHLPCQTRKITLTSQGELTLPLARASPFAPPPSRAEVQTKTSTYTTSDNRGNSRSPCLSFALRTPSFADLSAAEKKEMKYVIQLKTNIQAAETASETSRVNQQPVYFYITTKKAKVNRRSPVSKSFQTQKKDEATEIPSTVAFENKSPGSGFPSGLLRSPIVNP